jgi:hypothetical protein
LTRSVSSSSAISKNGNDDSVHGNGGNGGNGDNDDHDAIDANDGDQKGGGATAATAATVVRVSKLASFLASNGGDDDDDGDHGGNGGYGGDGEGIEGIPFTGESTGGVALSTKPPKLSRYFNKPATTGPPCPLPSPSSLRPALPALPALGSSDTSSDTSSSLGASSGFTGTGMTHGSGGVSQITNKGFQFRAHEARDEVHDEARDDSREGVGGGVATLAISTAQISSLFTHFEDEGDREGMGLYVWLRAVCLGKEDPLVRKAGVIGTSKREREGGERREIREGTQRGKKRSKEKQREVKRSKEKDKLWEASLFLWGGILCQLFNPS